MLTRRDVQFIQGSLKYPHYGLCHNATAFGSFAPCLAVSAISCRSPTRTAAAAVNAAAVISRPTLLASSLVMIGDLRMDLGISVQELAWSTDFFVTIGPPFEGPKQALPVPVSSC